MAFVASGVISNMIHMERQRHRLGAMGASLAVHAAVFGALLYAVNAAPPVIVLEERMVAVSLADFAPVRQVQAAEKPAVPAVKPPMPHAAETPVPVRTERKPLPRKKTPEPARTVPLPAEAPLPAPAAAETPPPQTPEIKGVSDETAPLSEALASPPSQAVTSAASTDSPPTPTPETVSGEPMPDTAKKADPKGVDATVLGRIRTMIEQAITYPAIARRLRLEGVVVLSFMLKPNGAVAEAEVLHSSGSAVLDREALNSLWDLSGDFPSLESLTKLTIPITFSLTHS